MLGLPQEALRELTQIPAALMTHPSILTLHWQAFADQKLWDAAYGVACELVALYPEKLEGWLNRAYASRRRPSGSLAQAYQALLPAAARFPEAPLVRFNLSCYAAQMERLDEAWGWFRDALTMGDPSAIRRMGLADEDLRALWPKISELME
jgi:hypothetical protein